MINMNSRETTYSRFQIEDLERDTGKASLYSIDGLKYWIPNSAHLYHPEQEAIDVADWFAMEPAGEYKPKQKPPQPKGTSDLTDRCPHCQKALTLLTVWQEKGEPEQGLRGSCRACGGLFEATPRTVFTVKVFYEKSKTEKELDDEDIDGEIPF